MILLPVPFDFLEDLWIKLNQWIFDDSLYEHQCLSPKKCIKYPYCMECKLIKKVKKNERLN